MGLKVGGSSHIHANQGRVLNKTRETWLPLLIVWPGVGGSLSASVAEPVQGQYLLLGGRYPAVVRLDLVVITGGAPSSLLFCGCRGEESCGISPSWTELWRGQ